MIDIHNHILPNIDDGSKSMEMSLNMLKFAYEQGLRYSQYCSFPSVIFKY